MTPEELRNFSTITRQLSPEIIEDWRIIIEGIRQVDAGEHAKFLVAMTDTTDMSPEDIYALAEDDLTGRDELRLKSQSYNYGMPVTNEEVQDFFEQTVAEIFLTIPESTRIEFMQSMNPQQAADFFTSLEDYVIENTFKGYDVKLAGYTQFDDKGNPLPGFEKPTVVDMKEVRPLDTGSTPIWWQSQANIEINKRRTMFDLDPTLFNREHFLRESIEEVKEGQLFGEDTNNIAAILLDDPPAANHPTYETYRDLVDTYAPQISRIMNNFDTGIRNTTNEFTDLKGGNLAGKIAAEVNKSPDAFFGFLAEVDLSADIDLREFRIKFATDETYRKKIVGDRIDMLGGVSSPSDDAKISEDSDLTHAYGQQNRIVTGNALDEFNKYIDENGNFKDGVVAAASDINIDPEYFVYANVLNAIGNEFSIRPGMGDNIYDASVNKWYSDTKEAEYKANPEALSDDIEAILFDSGYWRDMGDSDGAARNLLEGDFSKGAWAELTDYAIENGLASLPNILDEYIDQVMQKFSRDDAEKIAKDFAARNNIKWSDLSLEIQNRIIDNFHAHGRFDVDTYMHNKLIAEEDSLENYPELDGQDIAEYEESLKNALGVGLSPAQTGFGDQALDFMNEVMGRKTFADTRANPQQAILNYASSQGILNEDMSMDYYNHFVDNVLPELQIRAKFSDAENPEEFNEDLEKFFADLGAMDANSEFYDRQMDPSRIPMPTEEAIAAEPDLTMFGGLYGPGSRPTARPKPAEPVDMTAMNEAIEAIGEGRPEFTQFLQQQISSEEFQKAWREATAPIFDAEAYEESTSFRHKGDVAGDTEEAKAERAALPTEEELRGRGITPVGEAAAEAERIGQEAYGPSIRARTEATAARKALEGITDSAERARQEFQVKQREDVAGKLEGLVKEGFIEGEHRRGIKADTRERFTTRPDADMDEFVQEYIGTRLPGFEEAYRESPEAAAFRKAEETRMRSRLRVGRGGRGRALSVFQRGRR